MEEEDFIDDVTPSSKDGVSKEPSKTPKRTVKKKRPKAGARSSVVSTSVKETGSESTHASGPRTIGKQSSSAANSLSADGSDVKLFEVSEPPARPPSAKSAAMAGGPRIGAKARPSVASRKSMNGGAVASPSIGTGLTPPSSVGKPALFPNGANATPEGSPSPSAPPPPTPLAFVPERRVSIDSLFSNEEGSQTPSLSSAVKKGVQIRAEPSITDIDVTHMDSQTSVKQAVDAVPSWTRVMKGNDNRPKRAWRPGSPGNSSDSGQEDLELPGTKFVNDILEQSENAGATFLDIALKIVGHFQEQIKGEDAESECRFMRDCLQAGRNQTQMPCGLMTKQPTLVNLRRTCVVVRRPSNKDLGGKEKGGLTTWRTPPIRGALRAVRENSSSENGSPTKENGSPPAPSTAAKKGCPWMGEALPPWPVKELDPAMEAKIQQTLQSEFNSWNFDVFAFNRHTNGRPLLFVAWESMSRGNCFSEFGLNVDKAQQFFAQLEPQYVDLDQAPFHNHLHAADVTQAVHALIHGLGIVRYYDPMDILGTIFAAAIHDVGHDGRNNAYHVNVQDNLALTYNDQSVLESFHVSQGFKLLKNRSDTNFVEDMPREQFHVFRREVISMVLGTDMAHHFAAVRDFNHHCQSLGRNAGDWHQEEKTMDLFRSMVLHTADLSNPTKNMSIATAWADRCLSEFFLQGDEERKLGLPISPMCDRNTINVPSSQVGFIDFIVRPTFNALAEMAPDMQEVCLKGLDLMRRMWERRREQQAKQRLQN